MKPKNTNLKININKTRCIIFERNDNDSNTIYLGVDTFEILNIWDTFWIKIRVFKLFHQIFFQNYVFKYVYKFVNNIQTDIRHVLKE